MQVYVPDREQIMAQMGENFGKRIKEWRARQKISQSQAALQLKVPLRTLQHWEQRRMKPNNWRWREIAAQIGNTNKV